MEPIPAVIGQRPYYYYSFTLSVCVCICRSPLDLHQPGHPDMHRVLWDPQGDGSPRVQDSEFGPGQTGNIGAAGRVGEL